MKTVLQTVVCFIAMLNMLAACTSRPFSLPDEPETGYLMSDTTYTFRPEIAQLIDSFVRRYPLLEYCVYVDKLNPDSILIAIQGTGSNRRIAVEEWADSIHPLTKYKCGDIKVNVYGGSEVFVRPLHIDTIDYRWDGETRNEAFWVVYYTKDGIHIYEDEEIYPFTERCDI